MPYEPQTLRDSLVLVTGGTGSFGRAFIQRALATEQVKAIRIFSRDELKQYQMQKDFHNDPRLHFFLGDVRDQERLRRALEGVDIVIHAAALKHVPLCEYNPFEAVKTNIVGGMNVINAAIDSGVKKVIALSTDKAVNPVNLYGATKLCAERLFIQGNTYAGGGYPRFACVRYGNVVGSRGSVVPLFLEQRKTGILTITNASMTRFWITLPQAVQLVLDALVDMQGGEIFVPKLPSVKIVDMAKTIAPKAQLQVTEIRPGEKIHEALLTDAEARHTLEFKNKYVVTPEFDFWDGSYWQGGKTLPENFHYSSGENPWWLTPEELKRMLDEFEREIFTAKNSDSVHSHKDV